MRSSFDAKTIFRSIAIRLNLSCRIRIKRTFANFPNDNETKLSQICARKKDMINGSSNAVDRAKKMAAFACVDENVMDCQVIGVGTGTTALFVVDRIASKFHSGKLRDIICVPSSYDAKHLLVNAKLPLSSLDQHYQLDLYIDGADEIDQRLNCIKGGGGCMVEEKIVMSCSKKFYLIADYRKKSVELGQNWKYIPLEVCRNAHVPIAKRIESTEGGFCKLRSGTGKAGPVITDNGNFILDWHFPTGNGLYMQWRSLDSRLTLMPGVVETGLFVDSADKAYFGMEDGSVVQLTAPEDRPARR